MKRNKMQILMTITFIVGIILWAWFIATDEKRWK
tara:strand:+ start:110 stop:211 length:102 start_codon:yes stop_codon:yes gene_type:complete